MIRFFVVQSNPYLLFLLRIIYHIPNFKNYNNVITDYKEEEGGRRHPSFDSNQKSVVIGKRLIVL